jgi:multidrug efflux pump
VATSLERHLGIVADVIGMSSESTVGIARIILQFSLNRSLERYTNRWRIQK